MNIKIILFYIPFFSLLLITDSNNAEKIKTENFNQARQTAIQDFSKTNLFKMDSVFSVSLIDTLHRFALKKVNEGNHAWVRVKAYPQILVVGIDANPLKYLLDTTRTIDIQNKTIPSRVFEKDGRVFLWWDKNYPLTENTLETLNKFHLIKRGKDNYMDKFFNFRTDDAARGAHYYFCRNNLFIYKRVITNTAIGYYNPPDISCK